MTAEPADYRNRADQMVVCMARLLVGFEVLQLGLASPMGQVAACLAKQLNPTLLLEDPAALTLNDAPREASVTRSEIVALRQADQQFHAPEWITEVMPALADRAGQFIRPLEIDIEGRINTLRVRTRTGDWRRVAGLAGLAELAVLLEPFLVYLPRHDRRSFVERVQFSVAEPLSHSHAGAAARLIIVSDLAIIEIRRTGARVVSLHAGVAPAELLAQSPPGLTCAQPPVTAPPTDHERAALARVDPARVRDLELLSGTARRARLTALASDEALRIA